MTSSTQQIQKADLRGRVLVVSRDTDTRATVLSVLRKEFPGSKCDVVNTMEAMLRAYGKASYAITILDVPLEQVELWVRASRHAENAAMPPTNVCVLARKIYEVTKEFMEALQPLSIADWESGHKGLAAMLETVFFMGFYTYRAKMAGVKEMRQAAHTAGLVVDTHASRDLLSKGWIRREGFEPVLLHGEHGIETDKFAEVVAKHSGLAPVIKVSGKDFQEPALVDRYQGDRVAAALSVIQSRMGGAGEIDGGCVVVDRIEEAPLELQDGLAHFIEHHSYYCPKSGELHPMRMKLIMTTAAPRPRTPERLLARA